MLVAAALGPVTVDLVNDYRRLGSSATAERVLLLTFGYSPYQAPLLAGASGCQGGPPPGGTGRASLPSTTRRTSRTSKDLGDRRHAAPAAGIARTGAAGIAAAAGVAATLILHCPQTTKAEGHCLWCIGYLQERCWYNVGKRPMQIGRGPKTLMTGNPHSRLGLYITPKASGSI